MCQLVNCSGDFYALDGEMQAFSSVETRPSGFRAIKGDKEASMGWISYDWGVQDFARKVRNDSDVVSKQKDPKNKSNTEAIFISNIDVSGDSELYSRRADKLENSLNASIEETRVVAPPEPSDFDFLLPDPTGFRQDTSPELPSRSLFFKTRLPTSLAKLRLSPSTIASIASTPTSSPDTTPTTSPGTSPATPSYVPSPTKLSLLDLEEPMPILRKEPIEPKKHRKRVVFNEDYNRTRIILPAPLLEGEETNFYKKRIIIEEDEYTEEEEARRTNPKFDWDAFLHVEELIDRRSKTKHDW